VEAPTIAHSGGRLAFVSATESRNIRRVPFDPVAGKVRGQTTWVTRGARRDMSPDPSPDGTWVAFSTWGEKEALRNPHRKWYANPAVFVLDQFRLAHVYEKLGDVARARQWYERFLADWTDADPDIPEVVEARKRMAALGGGNSAGGTVPKSQADGR
jgi:hypothetical protein